MGKKKKMFLSNNVVVSLPSLLNCSHVKFGITDIKNLPGDIGEKFHLDNQHIELLFDFSVLAFYTLLV